MPKDTAFICLWSGTWVEVFYVTKAYKIGYGYSNRMIQGRGKFYAYILECQDGTYYAGYTNDLKKRLKRHNDGLASRYTRARLPVRLAWYSAYRKLSLALKTEAMIKKLTRNQKELLVRIPGRRFSNI